MEWECRMADSFPTLGVGSRINRVGSDIDPAIEAILKRTGQRVVTRSATAMDPYGERTTIVQSDGSTMDYRSVSDAHDHLVKQSLAVSGMGAARTPSYADPLGKHYGPVMRSIEVTDKTYGRMEILMKALSIGSVEQLVEVLVEKETNRIAVDPFKVSPFAPTVEYEDLPF